MLLIFFKLHFSYFIFLFLFLIFDLPKLYILLLFCERIEHNDLPKPVEIPEMKIFFDFINLIFFF